MLMEETESRFVVFFFFAFTLKTESKEPKPTN